MGSGGCAGGPFVPAAAVHTPGRRRRGVSEGRVSLGPVTTALYRRYRPEAFSEVIGQEHVTTPLMHALSKGRVTHAYLFSGPRGCGKTTSARILARCLNCAQGPTPTPCGTCDSCLDLANGGPGSIDVVEIDAASHNGVDDARDLRERVSFAPARDRFKVYILDEAHMVTAAGFNALLKTVEEPPPHVKFVFATTEPDKVLTTIRSRTHHYPFRLVPPAQLTTYLGELAEKEACRSARACCPSSSARAGGPSATPCRSWTSSSPGRRGRRHLRHRGRAPGVHARVPARRRDRGDRGRGRGDGLPGRRTGRRHRSGTAPVRRRPAAAPARPRHRRRRRRRRRGRPGRPRGRPRTAAGPGRPPGTERAVPRRRRRGRRAGADDGRDVAAAAARTALRTPAAAGRRHRRRPRDAAGPAGAPHLRRRWRTGRRPLGRPRACARRHPGTGAHARPDAHPHRPRTGARPHAGPGAHGVPPGWLAGRPHPRLPGPGTTSRPRAGEPHRGWAARLPRPDARPRRRPAAVRARGRGRRRDGPAPVDRGARRSVHRQAAHVVPRRRERDGRGLPRWRPEPAVPLPAARGPLRARQRRGVRRRGAVPGHGHRGQGPGRRRRGARRWCGCPRGRAAPVPGGWSAPARPSAPTPAAAPAPSGGQQGGQPSRGPAGGQQPPAPQQQRSAPASPAPASTPAGNDYYADVPPPEEPIEDPGEEQLSRPRRAEPTAPPSVPAPAVSPAPVAVAVAPEDDTPSRDDEDAEDAGLVGIAVVEQILGGRVLSDDS